PHALSAARNVAGKERISQRRGRGLRRALLRGHRLAGTLETSAHTMKTPTALAVSLCALLGFSEPSAAQQVPTRSIVNITGDLYRAQNDNHYTVFLVTPEGIIMSDPINRDF